MHRVSLEGRRARRADGTEPEYNDEMDVFQDLQLGSLAPLVCLEEFDVTFLSADGFGQDMDRIFEL